MEEKLTDALLDKMMAEHEQYLAALRVMPLEEILKKVEEYNAMQNILAMLDSWNVPEEQARALLKSPSPLADVAEGYLNQELDVERYIAAFRDAAKPNMEPPIYRQSVQYAMEHGEQDACFASQKAYWECRTAIDESINSHFDGMYLDKDYLSAVMTKWGPERVADVLACTVQQKERDGRFSRDNRAWANSIDTSHMGEKPYPFMANSHPALLDAFISKFRREVLEQSRSEKSAEKVQHKPAERSDDLEL